MSETDLQDKRPEWKDCIIPWMKSGDFVFLFTSEWYEVMYDKRTKAFDFVLCNRPPKLSEDTNMFAATTGLAYPMRIALVSQCQRPQGSCLNLGREIRLSPFTSKEYERWKFNTIQT